MNYPPPPQNTQVYPPPTQNNQTYHPTEQTMMEMQQNQQHNPQHYLQHYPDQYPQQNQPYDKNQQYNADPDNQQQWPEYHQPYYHGNFAAYGDFYFTPVMMKNNVPVKQDSSLHVPVIVVSIIFWAGIVVVAAGSSNFLDAVAIGVIIGLTYLLYLIISICCSDIRGYITNLKRFDEYKSMYDKMVNGQGYFHFWIQCYHYRTTRDSKGRTKRRKVVTHTASKKYEPKECFDDSGAVTGIQDVTKYVFLNYLKKFYFTDEKSAKNYDSAWSTFVLANRRDTHQSTSRTFEIEGFEPEVGFCAMGEGHNSCLFYLITFLGLALPYACILERSVSRYSLNIVKRLTC